MTQQFATGNFQQKAPPFSKANHGGKVRGKHLKNTAPSRRAAIAGNHRCKNVSKTSIADPCGSGKKRAQVAQIQLIDYDFNQQLLSF
ncbi:hypothetical protein [Phormidium sp. CCY1219]|uniref:hypothetical protein n=1 Tax=Phormidium sp. CCY1219 TaxID=2886104 RepID=UPI002D1F602A|nr:hypothetical protein [Phormidium sp. CCY1219]MEB3828712.1 hypothetical protein [Phormidium sp. CCY1219]